MSREAIIAIAKKEIGYTEVPDNKTKYGQWFGLDGVAWCGIFCSWVYAMAGHPLGNVGYLKGFAGVGTALAHWQGQITQDPKPGDLVIFDWNKDKKPEHVGLFVQWLDKSAGLFQTIEGNTSQKNQSNGGQVQLRQRNMAFVEAFINPLNLA